MSSAPSISEKRQIVAKAYGEAAVKKIAEAGGKSEAYKAAYAEKSGEMFVAGRDDRFIEGFYESLTAGKTVEELAALGAEQSQDRGTVDTMPTASMTLDEAMKLPRYAGMWPSQAQQYAARDLARAKAGNRGSADYQQGVRDAFGDRLSDAWKDGSNNDDTPRTPAQAHHQMVADINDAWKR